MEHKKFFWRLDLRKCRIPHKYYATLIRFVARTRLLNGQKMVLFDACKQVTPDYEPVSTFFLLTAREISKCDTRSATVAKICNHVVKNAHSSFFNKPQKFAPCENRPEFRFGKLGEHNG
jgi:hypothetical protein